MSEQPLAEGDSTDSDDSDGQDEEHQQVPTDAVESLAWEYEISIERLRPCLIRLRDAFVPGAEELTADKMGWAPIRLLRSSIEALGAEPGIALIKNTDLPALARRLRLIEYPAWHFTPLCTRDKLRVHLGTFLKYQDEVQDFLIRTGLPPREFSDSPWLYLQLGRLYDTRRTGSPYPGPDPGNPYVWVRWPEETVFYGRRWSQQTSFEESSFLKGLDSQDGSRLESLRRRFFAVRRAVIQKLVEALESRQSDTLLQECWEIMEKELSSGEVEFLLQMDPFYLGGNIRDHENTEVNGTDISASRYSGMI